MRLLLAAINELVKDQHQSKIEALASRLRQQCPGVAAPLTDYFSSGTANQKWSNITREALNLGLSGEYLAGLLLGSISGMEAERSVEKVDLVWSGPDIGFVPVRKSEQVLAELIDSATRTLHLMSFVLYKVTAIEDAIQRALDRGVEVHMLIETDNRDGSDAFRNTALGLKSRLSGLKLYCWPISRRGDSEGFASMHAKSFVSDRQKAFVTSANLTAAALDRNIEVGIVVAGGIVPRQIVEQFDALIATQVIVEF